MITREGGANSDGGQEVEMGVRLVKVIGITINHKKHWHFSVGHILH